VNKPVSLAPPTKENPLRITPDTAAAIRKTHPIEAMLLDIALMDGRAILVSGRSRGETVT
jgi:hypothetical protein